MTFSSCIEDTGGSSSTCASPGGMDGLDNAVFSAMSPDGRHLYVAAELERATPAGSSQGAIAVLSRNANTGNLAFVQTLKEGLNGVTSLQFAIDVAVSADGKHVYVTASSERERRDSA